jgi:hypothetical protein
VWPLFPRVSFIITVDASMLSLGWAACEAIYIYSCLSYVRGAMLVLVVHLERSFEAPFLLQHMVCFGIQILA